MRKFTGWSKRGGHLAAAVCGLGMLFAVIPARAETMTVGVENIDYSPHYAIHDGALIGFGGAMLARFAADEGLDLVFEALPVERLFRAVAEGDVDLKYPDNPEWWKLDSNRNRLWFSDPIIAYIDGVLVPPERLGEGMAGLREIGLVTGFRAPFWDELESSGRITFETNTSLDRLVQQAIKGRVSAVYGNVSVIGERFRRFGAPGAMVYDPALPHVEDDYRASSRARPDLIKRLDAWLGRNASTLSRLKTEHSVGAAVLE